MKSDWKQLNNIREICHGNAPHLSENGGHSIQELGNGAVKLFIQTKDKCLEADMWNCHIENGKLCAIIYYSSYSSHYFNNKKSSPNMTLVVLEDFKADEWELEMAGCLSDSLTVILSRK